MTKKKRNILIICIVGVLLILTAAVVTVVFAFNMSVDYNYNFAMHSNTLTAELDGDGGVVVGTVRSSAGAGSTEEKPITVTATTTVADFVLDVAADELVYTVTEGEEEVTKHYTEPTFGGIAASKKIPYEFDLDQNVTTYRYIFEDVAVSDGAVIRLYSADEEANIVPISVKAIAVAAAAKTVYADVVTKITSGKPDTIQRTEKTVEYENSFAASEFDLKLLNDEAHYGNMFELWTNYTDRKVKARVLYLVNDITLTDDLKLTVPCSINMLDSALTLGYNDGDNTRQANLKLTHSYAGAYYITAAGEGQINPVAGSTFTLTTPKAYYSVDVVLADSITVTDYNADDYPELLLSDALAFAESLIPFKAYSTLTLQHHYQTFGVDINYYYFDDDEVRQPFSGRVISGRDADEGEIKREGVSKTYEIFAEAKYKDKPAVFSVNPVRMTVVGHGADAMMDDLQDNFRDAYIYQLIVKNEETQVDECFDYHNLSVDLLTLVRDAFNNSSLDSITIAVEESSHEADDKLTENVDETILPLTDENAIKLTYYLYGDAKGQTAPGNTLTINRADISNYALLYIKKGTLIVSDSFTLTFKSGDDSVEEYSAKETYDMYTATPEEVMYYLRSSTTSFITNKPYPLLALCSEAQAAEQDTPYQRGAGIYSGTTIITRSDLGMLSLDWDIIVPRLDENGKYLAHERGEDGEIIEGRYEAIEKGENESSEDYFARLERDMVFIELSKTNPTDEDPTDKSKWVGSYFKLDTKLVEGEEVKQTDFLKNTMLEIISNATTIPDYMKLRYTATFAGEGEDIEKTYSIPVIKSIADDGGDSQQFESDNPFDALFLSSETNWLDDKNNFSFTGAANDKMRFAKIEILSVGGVDYNPSGLVNGDPDDPRGPYNSAGYPDHNMCYIRTTGEGLNENASEDIYVDEGPNRDPVTYYKSIDFVTDRAFVPDENTLVKVRCTLFNREAEAIVLTQDYTFTIYGLYKCSDGKYIEENAGDTGATAAVFDDADFYEMTIALIVDEEEEFGTIGDASSATYVTTLTDNSVDSEGNSRAGEKLLLSDSAYLRNIVNEKSEPVTLDYTQVADMVPTGKAEPTSIKGIERLSSVSEVILDGIRIKNVSSFADGKNLSLTKLSMSNCGLGNSDLYSATTATESYLYEIFLTDLNLSGNGLERVDNLAARTVKNLNLAINNLTDIAALSGVVELEILDVSGNSIYRFEVLKKLSNLKEVYLYENLFGDGALYGTDGLINIPHYVSVIKSGGVKIYAERANGAYLTISTESTDNKFSEGRMISKAAAEGSVGLNAFISPRTLTSPEATEHLYSEVTSLIISGSTGGVGGAGTSDYKFEFVYPDDENGYNKVEEGKVVFTDLEGNLIVDEYILGDSTPGGVECCYMVAISDSSNNILAVREFIVTITYNHTV